MKEAWEEFRKVNKFNLREKEIVRRLFRDGEVFLRVFVDRVEGLVKIRFIRASRIREPVDKSFKNASFGIKTDPDDIETPIEYYRCGDDGRWLETIPAGEMIHLKILSDADQKRGISIYRVCAKRLRQYEEWLEDRITLNKVRSAIALIRKVPSFGAKIKDIRDESASSRYGSGKARVKTPHRGTIITASKGIEYEMLSAKINAPDVAEDGRAILLAVAAAVGFPEMILTANYSNANYASTLVAQNPFVREIEDWQDYLSSFYKELYERVIEAKKEAGKLPMNVKADCKVDFPPMITAELEKMAKAYEVLFKYKVLSKKTWRGKMGLDDDIESVNLQNEEQDEVYGPPMPSGHPNQYPGGSPGAGGGRFAMPVAPVNQYGAATGDFYELMRQLVEALQENNMDRIIEIGEKLDNLEHGMREIIEKVENSENR
ncbi:MAG: hypothetical protein DRG39_07005 [Deltaproteobacteria bacterium]|nr:MAG: hypothetical protein DRG39_07005 [Deltaproteobacteria bacterium]